MKRTELYSGMHRGCRKYTVAKVKYTGNPLLYGDKEEA